MTSNNGRKRDAKREQIIETVASWPTITTGDGRFGSTAFYLAETEIGHLHSGLADIDYPKPLREQLLAEGKTEPHHAVPKHPTATTFHIGSVDDIDHTVWLFRLSYLAHLAILQQRGEEGMDVLDIDILDAVDALEPSDAIRDAFETAVTV